MSSYDCQIIQDILILQSNHSYDSLITEMSSYASQITQISSYSSEISQDVLSNRVTRTRSDNSPVLEDRGTLEDTMATCTLSERVRGGVCVELYSG